MRGKRQMKNQTKLDRVDQAKAWAEIEHVQKLGQTYDYGPYTIHLQSVVNVLERFEINDPDIIIAGWLHDIVEDTPVTLLEVEEKFGPRVSEIVGAVTNEPGKNRKERFAKTYPKIRAIPEAQILKLADRIANTEASVLNQRFLSMYLKEYPTFKAELYQPEVADQMWAHLDWLLLDKA